MVGGGELVGQQRLWASEVFSPALFVRTHLLIVPYFWAEVEVRDGGIGWNMGHDICVMNYSKVGGHLRLEKAGEAIISHSRLSHAVKLIHLSEGVLDVQSCNGGHSSSQWKACNKNFSPLIFLSQSIDLLTHLLFDGLEGIVEDLINETALAVWVGDLLGIGISNPVMNVNSAPEWDNDCIEL